MRNRYMHSMWVLCDTVSIRNPNLLTAIIQRTYGDFGFNRIKSPCFSLNMYIGKKSAAYVRATPKMSKESTTLSEYYRESFDLTFLPIIYKMINKLSE